MLIETWGGEGVVPQLSMAEHGKSRHLKPQHCKSQHDQQRPRQTVGEQPTRRRQ
ncbi:hypothetical protein [Synechococcus sp. CS-1328]|uniref:hypothetical protein n=1 Tax=Synechococcus sp. CS-1328 TaxID=2847976 RepID=UPI00223AB7C3|nr:hypothetical protein [Synechococcus sp. CS-1328]MCT0226473.1 hypothetical protein [Synechococcus sp. CS-1328]